MSSAALRYHAETVRSIPASPAAAFAYLDDHTRLSAHMSRSSWMMAGSRMTIAADDAGGRAPGSVIRLRGRMLGIRLSVTEVVTEREVPRGKTWETIGTPRLIVIGHYRMGFVLGDAGQESELRVFIDYALPDAWPGRWLGRVLGPFYARWCTRSMAEDAEGHFRRKAEVRP